MIEAVIETVIERVIEASIEAARNNLELLMVTLWICFAGYSVWYLTLANRYVSLTPNEADLLWKMHKQSVGCKAEEWRKIKRGQEIVGFECECGYRHVQKGPITLHATKPSVLDRLHTTYES